MEDVRMEDGKLKTSSIFNLPSSIPKSRPPKKQGIETMYEAQSYQAFPMHLTRPLWKQGIFRDGRC